MGEQDLGGELTERVIEAAIAVHRHFGPGFLEKTYHRALEVELKHRGVDFQSEVPVTLNYRGEAIGEGRIDLLIEGTLVVELKAARGDASEFKRQVAAYLKATGHPLGLLINFHHARLVDGVARVALSRA
ncbi:MAG: GxxExxY protein [Planctomycetota bacterium]